MALSLTFSTAPFAAASSGTATFTNIGIGAIATDRIVVIGAGADVSTNISGCTLDGAAATKLVQVVSSNSVSAFFKIRSTSASSLGTVVITHGSTSTTTDTGLGVWNLTGADFNEFDTDSGSGTNTVTLSAISVPTGGAAAFHFINGGDAAAITWVGATERSDADMGSCRLGNADTTSSGTLTVSASAPSASQTAVMTAVAFQVPPNVTDLQEIARHRLYPKPIPIGYVCHA